MSKFVNINDGYSSAPRWVNVDQVVDISSNTHRVIMSNGDQHYVSDKAFKSLIEYVKSQDIKNFINTKK